MTTDLIARLVPRRSWWPATRAGRVGLVLLVATAGAALVGPFFAGSPDRSVAPPFSPPDGDAPLGTDFLGRDVLARLLTGGESVLLYAGLATLVAYAVGITVGLAAGYLRSWPDPLLMRSVDVLLSFPSLVFILLFATAFGRGIGAVVMATAVIQLPAIARIIRTATLTQSARGYVEAAVLRGESSSSVLRREILPNITRTLSADVGLRFTWSVLLIASVNFLGLGLQPPNADWGLMVSENRAGMSVALNPWAVLAPALMLGLLTVAINLLGDAMSGDKK
ncbi:ABC transporter permease [Embleya scabrispora]|uniref:ABC transporter permease n=1 Tax=Embleya scabrispora TaxID=159449 RepID=UPI0003713465|nr:ABC transporter permease [Embleya scabrispora]MYS86919.1 ABC transporter permease subunit [Streptomyces sp. SID5474]